MRSLEKIPSWIHNLTTNKPDVKYERFAERLGPYITDTVHFMNESILQKKKILVEGGQATMLDIDFGMIVKQP